MTFSEQIQLKTQQESYKGAISAHAVGTRKPEFNRTGCNTLRQCGNEQYYYISFHNIFSETNESAQLQDFTRGVVGTFCCITTLLVCCQILVYGFRRPYTCRHLIIWRHDIWAGNPQVHTIPCEYPRINKLHDGN